MEIDFSVLGKRISQRRHELWFKQCTVAEKAGISNNYLSNIENGKSIPSLQSFSDICIALSTTPDYFFLGTIRTDDAPKVLIDNLKLCNDEAIEMINDMVPKLDDKSPILMYNTHRKGGLLC